MKISASDVSSGATEEVCVVFRVVFYDPEFLDSAPPSGGGTRSFDISESDIVDTIYWAQNSRHPGETFSIALILPSYISEKWDLYWILGADGNDSSAESLKARERMVSLRDKNLRLMIDEG